MLSSYNWFILSSVTLDKELVTDNLRDDSRVCRNLYCEWKGVTNAHWRTLYLKGSAQATTTENCVHELPATLFCKPFVQPCYGLFILQGTGTENRPGTIGNNGPGLCLCLKSSMNISTIYYTFHLVSIPVPFPCSVNKPLGWFQTRLLGRKLHCFKL